MKLDAGIHATRAIHTSRTRHEFLCWCCYRRILLVVVTRCCKRVDEWMLVRRWGAHPTASTIHDPSPTPKKIHAHTQQAQPRTRHAARQRTSEQRTREHERREPKILNSSCSPSEPPYTPAHSASPTRGTRHAEICHEEKKKKKVKFKFFFLVLSSARQRTRKPDANADDASPATLHTVLTQ